MFGEDLHNRKKYKEASQRSTQQEKLQRRLAHNTVTSNKPCVDLNNRENHKEAELKRPSKYPHNRGKQKEALQRSTRQGKLQRGLAKIYTAGETTNRPDEDLHNRGSHYEANPKNRAKGQRVTSSIGNQQRTDEEMKKREEEEKKKQC